MKRLPKQALYFLVLSFILLPPAALAARDTTVDPALSATGTTVDFSGFWELNANGYTFHMHLEQVGTRVTGTMRETNSQERHNTIVGKVQGNEILFTRANAALQMPQHYHGYSFNYGSQRQMAGVFSHDGAWSYGWTATGSKKKLVADTAKPAGSGGSPGGGSGGGTGGAASSFSMSSNGFAFQSSISSDGGTTTDGATPSHGDFESYKRSLTVADTNVQASALYALSRFPQGFDLIADFLERKPFGGNARAAARALVSFESNPRYVQRVSRIVAVYEQNSTSDESVAFDVRRTLYKSLFKIDKRFGKQYVATILRYLQKQSDTISFGDEIFDEILTVVPFVDKRVLYPLVPELTRFLDTFFHQVPPRAQRCLAAITGTDYYLSERSTKTERAEVAEKYRALYYQKLAPR